MKLSHIILSSLCTLSVCFVAHAENAASSTSKSPPIIQQPVHSKININTATTKELGKVKGLTKTRVKNLLSYRSKQGNFTNLADIKLVKGFGKMKSAQLELIQNQLTL